MTPEDIRALYDFNVWANHRALDACAPLTAEQFTRRIESSFPSVRDTLTHMLAAEWIWLERWQGRSPVKAEWDGFAKQFSDFAALRAWWQQHERRQLEFVASISAEQLARPHEIRTLDGTPYIQPLWQMMQHLANHSTYHRGQVTTMLRQLGARPVGTDLITFYRERGATAAR